MMKEFLFNLIRKRKYEISIYTEEIFERRCQEEIIRSDEDDSSFVYLEFDFDTLRGVMRDSAVFNHFWDIFLATMSKNGRSSDIIGFLEHNTGLGLLLLDSKVDGWNRLKGRIEQMAIVYSFKGDMLEILDQSIRPILYPACIQNLDGTAAENEPSVEVSI